MKFVRRNIWSLTENTNEKQKKSKWNISITKWSLLEKTFGVWHITQMKTDIIVWKSNEI